MTDQEIQNNREQIENIFEKHNVKYERVLATRLQFVFNRYLRAEKKQIDDDLCTKLELIQFSDLLKKAIKRKKAISIKSGNVKFELKNKDNMRDIILFIDSLIEQKQDGFYQFQFKWEFKKSLYPPLTVEEFDRIRAEYYPNIVGEDAKFELLNQLGQEQETLFANFTEPYTEEETATILNYEHINFQKSKEYNKKEIALKLKDFIRFAREKGAFDNVKTIRTHEACFLYDILVYFNIIENDLSANNQDKYQFIKQELKKVHNDNANTKMFVGNELLDYDKLAEVLSRD